MLLCILQSAGGTPHYNDYFEQSFSKTTLLIIDPQNDFHPGGSLAIATAADDAARIAQLLTSHAPVIDDVIVSLDTHQQLHVAHGLFWRNAAGAHPAPFTPISVADVESGAWQTTDPQWQTWGLEYVRALEANQRFELLIWPEVLGVALRAAS
jgi:nicotinamidase-related amidase